MALCGRKWGWRARRVFRVYEMMKKSQLLAQFEVAPLLSKDERRTARHSVYYRQTPCRVLHSLKSKKAGLGLHLPAPCNTTSVLAFHPRRKGNNHSHKVYFTSNNNNNTKTIMSTISIDSPTKSHTSMVMGNAPFPCLECCYIRPMRCSPKALLLILLLR